MECKQDCPKIKSFVESIGQLNTQLEELEREETTLQGAQTSNRSSRRMLARNQDESTETHEAKRSLSDAEFYASEAQEKFAVARQTINEAIVAQEVAINTFVELCPTGQPIEAVEARELGQAVIECAIDRT